MAATEGSEQGAQPEMAVNTTNGYDHGEEEADECTEKWGFPKKELYQLALGFYKDKEGKAMQLSYKDKLRLVALTKQVAHGKYRSDILPDVGFLNVVGNDRRAAWQGLGDMDSEAAMLEFIRHLDTMCPLFKPFLAAHKAEKEEQLRLRKEEEERLKREEEERERQAAEEEVRQREQQEQNRQQQQELQIRAALNQQTAVQFRQYAEQQYPGSPEQQEQLMVQLQEQHYQQYMQQVYQQQLMHQQQQYTQLQALQTTTTQHAPNSQPPPGYPPHPLPTEEQLKQHQVMYQTEDGSTVSILDGHRGLPLPGKLLSNGDAGDQEEEEGNETDQSQEVAADSMPPLMPASMWTRSTIREFKDNVRKNPENVIKIGSLATATVRVPTHEDGTCLFWEFATDSYDLGFGVYFEWTIAPSNQVSVHVSESSDEEEGEEEEGGSTEKGDVEKGGPAAKKDNRPPTDEIIPVYRRDSHEEVYCGSHMYPGRGVYLLKFDNSYSLWRSKTLYYRVYYTR